MLSVTYWVFWQIVANYCGALQPFVGFGCPEGSRMELIDFITLYDDGYPPSCSKVGLSEGICTEEQPLRSEFGSFRIGTGVVFRCHGTMEADLLGWATIPDQLGVCNSAPSTVYHEVYITLVRDFNTENEISATDYDCSLGFSTLEDGKKHCADLNACMGYSWTYGCMANLREITVVQNSPIPDRFITETNVGEEEEEVPPEVDGSGEDAFKDIDMIIAEDLDNNGIYRAPTSPTMDMNLDANATDSSTVNEATVLTMSGVEATALLAIEGSSAFAGAWTTAVGMVAATVVLGF